MSQRCSLDVSLRLHHASSWRACINSASPVSGGRWQDDIPIWTKLQEANNLAMEMVELCRKEDLPVLAFSGLVKIKKLLKFLSSLRKRSRRCTFCLIFSVLIYPTRITSEFNSSFKQHDPSPSPFPADRTSPALEGSPGAPKPHFTGSTKYFIKSLNP